MPVEDSLQEFLTCVEANASDASILTVPAEKLGMTSDQTLTLESLVAQITPQNLHTERDFGRPVGDEVW